jgi:xylulokinase
MYLGIDLGTSGIKVLLLNDAQQVQASADAPLDVSRPQPLWSEQQPSDWWQTLNVAMQSLKARAPQAMAAVRAIGLSGQMHGAVVLDANSEVLRPAILWNDGRSDAQCRELESSVPHSRQITGNLAMPGFTAPKLLWLRTHEPHIFEKVAKVLLPKDWLRLQLTGEAVSEMSDASGTLWLDVGARRWSGEMLAACGLGIEHMPRLVEGSAVSGALLASVAKNWGLPEGIPIAGGGGDNAASAVGVGAVRAGQGFISLGTSGVVFQVSDAFDPQPARALHAFAHALPDRWHHMAVMLSASSALTWVARLTQTESEAQLAALAGGLTLQQRAHAPIFLPYLAGERTPHNNVHASGTFIGLRHDHDRAALAYAVMEGVSLGLMDGASSMGTGQGTQADWALVGGGAQSDVWAQLLCSGFNRSLVRYDGAHAAAALGAARLAWLADGGDEADVCAVRSAARRFEPVAAETALLRERFSRFMNLYPALADHFLRSD